MWECITCGERRIQLKSSQNDLCLECSLQRALGPDYRSKTKAKLDAKEGKKVAQMSLEHVAGDIYKVGSASSTRVYTVDVGESTCTCTNWAIQRNRLVGAAEKEGKSAGTVSYACKHVREVIEACGGKSPTKKRPVKESKDQTKAKADSIVAKFTTPGTRKRAIETLRQAAQMKKE